MTATPETTRTIHVDVLINMPLDDGGFLPVRTGIGAIPTRTEGLVVFPVLTGPFEIDDSRWSVTHVGSGLRVPATFPDQEHATAFADAAGSLAPWWEERPVLSRDARLRMVDLVQEHGGTLDQRVLDGMARRDASSGDGGGE